MQHTTFRGAFQRRLSRKHHLKIHLARAGAVAVLAGCSVAHAQFRASLTGTVSDPQGASVPGATVTLTDTDTGRTLNATSNEAGVYNFGALPPDHFTLKTTMSGFQTSTVNGITITPEQANNIDVKLVLGSTNAIVDVNADTIPPLETSTASLSGVVTSDQIQHLPSAGRDVFQLAQLAPGAFGDGQQSGGGGTNSLPGTQGPGGSGASQGVFATENGPQTLSGGGQYETNSISIDGISTTSAVWGGTTVITPNEDSVDNVKITTNNYDAEFGRFSGANLQVTTKAGTNQVHGSLFFRADRPGLNAYQRYNGPGSLSAGNAVQRGLLRDTARLNDIGGSVGGPVLKNRVFAFFAYETIRNNSQTTANGWYDTAAFDAAAPTGNISNTFTNFAGHAPVGATLINQTCVNIGLLEGQNCNTIANQGLDIGSPLKTAKGTQDPTYKGITNPGVGAGLDSIADIADYQTSTPTTTTQTQYNGRADADVTKRDHLAFAIYWQPVTNHYINGPARGYNQWNHNQINDAFSVIYNHTFSSSFLNEARANAAGWRWNEVTDNPQAPFGLPTDSFAADNNGHTIGSITLNYFGASGPSHLNQWTYGYKDVATKIIRTHTIKFGGDATQLHYLQDAVYAARPSFNFYNVWNFLNDAPYAESGTFDRFTGIPFSNRFDMREWIYGGFVQDDWKITSSLTLNLGLRYNYFDSLYSKQDNLPHVQFGAGTALFTGIDLARGGKVWTPEKNNLGPQFGFAYNPALLNKRVVLRGGYGINYNQEEIAISANGSFNPSDAVSPAFNNSTPTAADPRILYNVPSDPTSLFGYASNPNTVTAYGANGLPTTGGFNLTAYPNRLHTQQVHHYSLDVQGDLGHQLVATVGYQGSTAHHLIFHQNLYVYGQYHGYAFNPASPFLEYFGDSGGSNYNALLLDLKHNMSRHFTVDASFTYSKSMDDNSGPYEEDPYPYNPTYARGRSDFNFGKALKIYGVYEPTLFYGHNEVARTLLNGFTISGIYNLHTGFPWTPVSNTGGITAYYTGSGYGTLRPAAYNGRAGRNYSNNAFIPGTGTSNFNALTATNAGHPGLDYYTPPPAITAANSSAFPAPIPFYPVPGVARNSLNGPGYQDVDATVTKSFGVPANRILGERGAVEIRADAFNLFNQTNLNVSQISNDITAGNFGIVQGNNAALGSRTVQLQAKFSF